MAIDTETKRRSMFAHGLVSHVVLPVPDGTIATIDQKHFMGLMAVIATQLSIQTDLLHIISTSTVEPEHVSDSGDNVLIAGDLEVQGGTYVEGTLTSLSGVTHGTSRYTSTQTLDADDHIVFCNGTFTVTLPASPSNGQTYRIINSGTGTITIDENGKKLFGSITTDTLNAGDVVIITYETTEGWW